MKWELTIYLDGSAILTDERGRTEWTSDNDDALADADFPDVLTFEDGDDLAEYLEDAGYLPEGVTLDIVEAEETGEVRALADGDVDDDDDEDDEDEDDDE